MTAYPKQIMELLPTFERFELVQIPCCENSHGNALSKLAISKDSELLAMVPMEHLPMPSIYEELDVMWVENILSWMGPIIAFLQNYILSSNKEEA